MWWRQVDLGRGAVCSAVDLEGGNTGVKMVIELRDPDGAQTVVQALEVYKVRLRAAIERTKRRLTEFENRLKDYMESGSFARGKEEIPAEASLVFLGNTRKPTQELVRTAHLFADLPKAMIDPAFLDRLHFYSHLNARDEKAVRKTISGLLKLLHPHGEWTRGDLREYLEFAVEGRRRGKEQLKKLAAYDYAKTSFSYVERDPGREYWVEVPEQPEDAFADALVGDAGEEQASDAATAEGVGLEDLIAGGESSRVVFKSSARWHYYASRLDDTIELEVAKTIAGFMNAHGATLVIGVDDAGKPIGLERDFGSVKGHTRDGFENWLTNLLEATIGKPALANVSLEWAELEGNDVCRVDAAASGTPVFVHGKGAAAADLYVRTGNSTRLFNTSIPRRR